MKGVVLAGGTGSRLRPITHTGPKQLVPIANKPVIDYVVEDFREAGVTDIGVVLGRKGREAIQSHLGDGSDWGVDITYIVQGEPLGLAHAVGCAADFVADDDFVVYLGDNVLKSGIGEMVDRFADRDAAASIALQRVDDPGQFGVAELDEGGRVVELVEKPDNPPSDHALIGIYVFSTAVFDAIEEITPSWRNELEITDAIQWLIESGLGVDSHLVEGWWKDTGKPEDILDANRLVLEDARGDVAGTIEEAAEVTGDVIVAEGAVIEQGAVVRGPASIGEETMVSSGVYVGPYTSIGPDSVLRDVRIENSVVVGGSTISTEGRIVDSLIGQGTEISDASGMVPTGQRLVVGENSKMKL